MVYTTALFSDTQFEMRSHSDESAGTVTVLASGIVGNAAGAMAAVITSEQVLNGRIEKKRRELFQ